MVSVRFSGRYKNLGRPFIGLPLLIVPVPALIFMGHYNNESLSVPAMTYDPHESRDPRLSGTMNSSLTQRSTNVCTANI